MFSDNEKRETITKMLVMVLKSFEKLFNFSTMISKIQSEPYKESKNYLIKILIKDLKKVPCHNTLSY